MICFSSTDSIGNQSMKAVCCYFSFFLFFKINNQFFKLSLYVILCFFNTSEIFESFHLSLLVLLDFLLNSCDRLQLCLFSYSPLILFGFYLLFQLGDPLVEDTFYRLHNFLTLLSLFFQLFFQGHSRRDDPLTLNLHCFLLEIPLYTFMMSHPCLLTYLLLLLDVLHEFLFP